MNIKESDAKYTHPYFGAVCASASLFASGEGTGPVMAGPSTVNTEVHRTMDACLQVCFSLTLFFSFSDLTPKITNWEEEEQFYLTVGANHTLPFLGLSFSHLYPSRPPISVSHGRLCQRLI